MCKKQKRAQVFSVIGVLIVATIVSYLWLDKLVVNYTYPNISQPYKFFRYFAELAAFYYEASIFLIVSTVLWQVAGRKLQQNWQIVQYASFNVLVTAGIKDQLKFIFARTWPNTWVHNNPSWLHDHVYGFFWFIKNQHYASFPSGHSAVIFAFMSVLAFLNKRLRLFALVNCALVIIGLIAMSYHFVSDITAGAALGIATGYATTLLYRNNQQH